MWQEKVSFILDKIIIYMALESIWEFLLFFKKKCGSKYHLSLGAWHPSHAQQVSSRFSSTHWCQHINLCKNDIWICRICRHGATRLSVFCLLFTCGPSSVEQSKLSMFWWSAGKCQNHRLTLFKKNFLHSETPTMWQPETINYQWHPATSSSDRVNNSFQCVMGRSHQLWDELLKWWGQRIPLIGTWRGNNHLTGAWNICQQPTISYHWITLSAYWASDWPMQLCCYIQQFFIYFSISSFKEWPMKQLPVLPHRKDSFNHSRNKYRVIERANCSRCDWTFFTFAVSLL